MPGIEDAERALAQADDAFARFDLDAVVAHLSAAIREFTAAEKPCQAAMACVRLGDTMANYLGNLTAARAWFSRATRLVAGQPLCLEQGWVAVAAMGCDVDDPADLLVRSELALDRARQFGDLNLETKALADAGLAHVQLGHVIEGMALLDEAMALACGPADDRGTAAKSVCSFFTACYFAVDFERAGSWADLLRQRGLIGLGAPGPVFLSSHCDSVQATLLLELGRWHDAEALLERARADFEATMGTASWHPDIALADLRTRQGRYAEAEVLLLGKDQSMQALLPAARLHLERGDPDLSLAAARCKITRPGRPPTVRTFSLEDAQYAKLLNKQGPWTEYRERQMAWRAFWFAARDGAADILRGMGGAEEAMDMKDMGPADVVGAPPPPPAPPAAPPEPPAYSQAELDANVPAWRKAFAERKATPDALIARIGTKAVLSEAQKNQIRNLVPIENGATTTPTPTPTAATQADPDTGELPWKD